MTARRKANGRRWIGRGLVLGGAGVLAWCAQVVADGRLAQRMARESLAAAASAVTASPSSALDVKAFPPRREPILTTGAPVAALSIPRLALSEIVLHGSDARTLRRGPGHLEQTPLPGEAGNVVIAGHRDTFFAPLGNLQVGDDIFMDTWNGRFHYQVTALDVVNPHDVSVLAPTRNATLTLITCYPFWVLGPAPDRFVVRAAKVAGPADDLPDMVPVERGASVGAAVPMDAVEMPAITRTRAVDDATLVREAIERFRLTYNARLISHNDARAAGPLRFAACDVHIDGSVATATCRSSDERDSDTSPQWTMTLWHSVGGWAIKTIVAGSVPQEKVTVAELDGFGAPATP